MDGKEVGIMQYKAMHRHADMSARKIRPFADLIRGKSYSVGCVHCVVQILDQVREIRRQRTVIGDGHRLGRNV